MDGILIVDKPQGMTSHDVVDFMRKTFRIKKIGHAGTLDPMATGVLVMLVGSFTRQSQSYMSDEKEYEGAIVLGATSDTGDAWGKIEKTSGSFDYTAEEIDKVFKKFLGEIEQLPPMYSAVKYKGRKLYELARKGMDIERSPRKIVIKKLDILKTDLPEIEFRLTCSKGTYVRQLAVDIGRMLGCGAYLSGLRRTRSGRFTIENAMTMEKLKMISVSNVEKCLLG